ncbi:MAG: DUF2064 domain-containing protein [Chitinophagales bacterium]|nr:DUF2064 domain-containing protein [Chitinophagales bacterium]
MQQQTAILLFTRTADDEARHKRFVQDGNSLVNQSIATGFINRTIRELKKSGFPFFIISSERQVGNSFGERLTNAFREVFHLGFEHVIAVGNDAPQLNTGLLNKAASLLHEQKLVVGPDKRGGAYLIGLSKNSFDAEALSSIHWNTTHVSGELIEWMQSASIEFATLDAIADINGSFELTSLLRSKIFFNHFFQKLRSIIASARSLSSYTELFLAYRPGTFAHSRRGPPCL